MPARPTCSVTMPPGQYQFVSWGEGTPALEAQVEAGRVYYVEVGTVIGAWTARARLFGVGPRRPNCLSSSREIPRMRPSHSRQSTREPMITSSKGNSRQAGWNVLYATLSNAGGWIARCSKPRRSTTACSTTWWKVFFKPLPMENM